MTPIQNERPMYRPLMNAFSRLFVVDCQMQKIIEFLEKYESEEARKLAYDLKQCEDNFRDLDEPLK
jgi:hypothetical protein